MLIGGLQKFSVLDYPGHISAIIFTKGCNFKCQFCYNPMLVYPSKKDHTLILENDLFYFLKKRIGKLDSVVITGGEPTVQQDLPKFIQKIKKLNYLVKLDTNGTNPEMLKNLIQKNLINYIAMDIKAPLEKYNQITGVEVDFNKIQKSIKIIMQSNLPYEFRTTVVPKFLDAEDIKKIGELIQGAKKWFLQNFKSNTDLVNKKLENKSAFLNKKMKEMCEVGKQYVKNCEIR
ncbi:anaerobic ribonucleoside-triphosphate reductase activating protein [Patescibacteria group bacterium]|nr:anaerobic ribonucleoside-triphosphate reductase activating protein [Patescibacteria group bacterium]MBU2416074.1 anaerobic ribonucleoside-triphosphate reductase activating protein [Patescibacteria group bacterium]